MSRSVILAAVASLALFGACRDSCVDVQCGPAPPVLQVVVLDTVPVDTTLLILRGDPERVDTVDTTVIRTRAISDAVVTLERVTSTDTTVLDTVPYGTEAFERTTEAEVPAVPFRIRARRGSRSYLTPTETSLRQVEGCCAYPIVGRFTLTIL